MADITLINLNLLWINMGDHLDAEVHTPLGPLYVMAALEREGFDVDFRDFQWTSQSSDGDPFDMATFLAFSRGASRIIGLSCMANLLPFALSAAEALKREDPDRFIILGGVGSYGVEAKILERFPCVDVVVRGEAEKTAPELLHHLLAGRPLRDLPGIFLRLGQKAQATSARRRISDLDDIPFPAYHRVRGRSYDAFGMISSRGCPFECAFCTVKPIWGKQAKHRTANNIRDEIELLRSYWPVDEVLFQDEYFVSTPPRMRSVLEALRNLDPPLSWKCFGRVNLVDDHLMNQMAAANCRQIRFGIESGSNRILRLVTKGFTYERALEAARAAVGIFESVEAFFMWGFPFETRDDFMRTAAAMVQCAELGVRVLPSLFSPLPQSAIYRDYLSGRWPARLVFQKELIPVYVISGHEEVRGWTSIPRHHQKYFDLVTAHPDIFPGHYLFDPEENALPKFEILRELGFYST